jgi:hypothetical protein
MQPLDAEWTSSTKSVEPGGTATNNHRIDEKREREDWLSSAPHNPSLSLPVVSLVSLVQSVARLQRVPRKNAPSAGSGSDNGSQANICGGGNGNQERRWRESLQLKTSRLRCYWRLYRKMILSEGNELLQILGIDSAFILLIVQIINCCVGSLLFEIVIANLYTAIWM